jgi:hypothetical protein
VEALLAVHARLHGQRPLALAEVLAPHLLAG